MEAVATLLAALVGAMALVRYYSRPESLFLFIGAGFLGTAFLDGFHAIVTSAYFKPLMPSDLPSLLPWSWVASRQFLSILMVLSWIAWMREDRLGAVGRIPERTVYLGTAIFTAARFLFFIYAPLPVAYYSGIFFHRPEEFLPALFFLVALIGFLRKGHWRHDAFEHWLVLSLIVGFISQAVFMSHSSDLFDYEFDIAHTLKKASYICVLTGLLINMYVVFRRESEAALSLTDSEQRMRAIVDNVFDGIVTINEKGTILSVNPVIERIFGYTPTHLVGRNVKLLAPEPIHSAHDGYLQNYITTGNAKIIGIGREVVGLRANGSTFPMELEVAEFQLDNERLFLGVVRDITERKEVDRMKSEFISTVSHELRTPLTSIKGSLGMTVAGALGEIPEKARDMIDIAHKNTERLINLVNDILDIEKLQSGSMEFDFEELDLSKLVERSIEDNKGYAKEHGIEFILKESVPDIEVYVDGGRITQVIANLLSNAAKFSARGGKVEVSVVVQDGIPRVSISDHGTGIPEDFRDEVFGRFTQADSSDIRQRGGTGLGLNISKSIIEKHGGRIWFDTETGAGTTFHFDLPAMATGDALSTAIARAVEGAGLHVLICEDDPDIANLFSMMLEQSGFAADVAPDAETAKKFLANKRYDAMTVDIMLPGQDGLSLIRELRQREDTKDLAMVVVSVKARQARREALEATLGNVDWQDKPIDPNLQISAVNRAQRVKASGSPKVLYVEDDADLVDITKAMLKGVIEIIPAKTKEAGERLLLTEKFDLVIIDISLPDGSGLDLLDLIRDDGSRLTPVIIFSGHEVSSAIAGRVEAALVKSRVSNEELVETIKSLIAEGRSLENELAG